MILGKLKFSDTWFSSLSKHQMLMSSEHQYKWFSCSQETLDKHLVHYLPNIFVYCKNTRKLRFIFQHSVGNIRNKKHQIFSYFSVLAFSQNNFLEIKLLSIAYYYQSRVNISIMFLQKIIKFFNLKQKQSLRGNMMVSVSVTYTVTEYFWFLSNPATSAVHT